MDQDLKVVLITGTNLEHRYVANILSSEIKLSAIVVDHGKAFGQIERISRLWRRYSVSRLGSRAMAVVVRRLLHHDKERSRCLAAVLGKHCLQFDWLNQLIHVYGINAPESVVKIASLCPDILLVFGTGIVSDKVLALANCRSLNMHTGISPHYRGCDCAFWPIHNGEPHMLGATVHECTSSVDGGEIYGTVHASLEPQDCVHTAFARCVKAGASLYAAIVNQMLRGVVTGIQQDLSHGTEYKGYMRTWRAEIRARRLVRRGLISNYVTRIGDPSRPTQ